MTEEGAAKPVRKLSARSRALARFEKTFAKYAALPPVITGHYCLDFGFLIKGSQSTKTFRIQNTSTQSLQLSVDRTLLEAYGCSLTPEKLGKLAGPPEFASMELALTMHTAVAHVFPGPVEFHIPFVVRNGPPVLVTVKAAIMMPEVQCSVEALPFGAVQSGLSKVMTVRLTNPKPVPCEWSLRKPVEELRCKDWSYFRCAALLISREHIGITCLLLTVFSAWLEPRWILIS